MADKYKRSGLKPHASDTESHGFGRVVIKWFDPTKGVGFLNQGDGPDVAFSVKRASPLSRLIGELGPGEPVLARFSLDRKHVTEIRRLAGENRAEKSDLYARFALGEVTYTLDDASEQLALEALKKAAGNRSVAEQPRPNDEIAKQADRRPLWADRVHHPELANLSSPSFLRKVWGDTADESGFIAWDAVAPHDPELARIVSYYIAKRRERGLTMGDAEGIFQTASSTDRGLWPGEAEKSEGHDPQSIPELTTSNAPVRSIYEIWSDMAVAIETALEEGEQRLTRVLSLFSHFETAIEVIEKKTPQSSWQAEFRIFERSVNAVHAYLHRSNYYVSDAMKNIINIIDNCYNLMSYKFDRDNFVRQKDEGSITDGLIAYFQAKNLPRELWDATAAEIERVMRKQVVADHPRPLWEERAQFPELANLSAPEFLKRVWADQIDSDGQIERDLIARRDRKLLLNVSTYISKREDRGQSLGDATGLRLVGSKVGRPRRSTLG